MDIHEHEVPEYRTNACIRLCSQELDKLGHRVAHGLGFRRHVPGTANVDLPGAVSGEIGGGQDASADTGAEQCAVPGSMVPFEDVPCIGTIENLAHASLHDLEGFVVADCGHGIFLLPVGGIPVRIPGPAANAFDELTAHSIALDRQ